MANILYGVHGTGHGHAIRALTVARHFHQHEFLFVTHGTAETILGKEFKTFHCMNPETPIKNHRIDTIAMFRSSLQAQLRQSDNLKTLAKTIDDFKPDVAISDYESFVPAICRKVSIPCLSFDHQHILPFCSSDIPFSGIPGYWITRAAILIFFNKATDYLVTSFYRPPSATAASGKTSVLPPLLRETIIKLQPSDKGHVVSYQGYSTFNAFIPFLKTIDRKVMVYGTDKYCANDNLVFKAPSESQFLEDLASCSYVICGGGHTLISEALYLGKPVLSFPVRHACEQQLNALYLQRLGYGMFSSSYHPTRELAQTFEMKLECFRKTIRGNNFLGNPEIFARINGFIQRTNGL
ncbi:MAG: glycosyltransferase family protein [Kiritimatiellae bacterium]|nr:glycosyltransferase family protein [Kiritimatiellia bacterium]